jgi:hypothetical protein
MSALLPDMEEVVEYREGIIKVLSEIADALTYNRVIYRDEMASSIRAIIASLTAGKGGSCGI